MGPHEPGVVVWWTIPDSAVAWAWHPADSAFAEATLVRDDGGCLLVSRGVQPHRWPEPQRPAGHALAEMTAFFAMETNIRPTGMAITWIRGDRAVRWVRGTGRWSRHRVDLREGRRRVDDGDDLPDAPAPRDVGHAGEIALDLLRGLLTSADRARKATGSPPGSASRKPGTAL